MEEVNALILESVTAWKNYKKMPSRSSEGVTRRSTNAQDRSNVYSKFSGLGMSHGFNDLIRIMLFQKVIE